MTSLLDDQFNTASMVVNVQPVPDLFTITVDWQGFAAEDIQQAERD